MVNRGEVNAHHAENIVMFLSIIHAFMSIKPCVNTHVNLLSCRNKNNDTIIIFPCLEGFFMARNWTIAM